MAIQLTSNLRWVPCDERKPATTCIVPACSCIDGRSPPEDWLDSLCQFNAEAKPGESEWQHSSGFYDNGITHWLEWCAPTQEQK